MTTDNNKKYINKHMEKNKVKNSVMNSEKNKRSKNKKRKINFFINIIIIILVIIFIYSGYNVTIWLISDYKTKKLETELFSNIVYEVNSNENEEKNNDELKVDFNKLKEINSDIIAWIRIKDTYINYPVLQGETDEYYLKKDIYKKYSVDGSIFVNTDANSNFEDDNTTIFGHNMKNGRMFANLHRINRGELGDDVSINIVTENSSIVYKIFSVYISEPNEEIIKRNFETEEEKEEYINNALSKTNIKFKVNKDNINLNGKILTLITCDSNNKRRVIVHAIENL